MVARGACELGCKKLTSAESSISAKLPVRLIKLLVGFWATNVMLINKKNTVKKYLSSFLNQ